MIRKGTVVLPVVLTSALILAIPAADASWSGRNGYLVAATYPTWKSFPMKRGTRARRLAGVPSGSVAVVSHPVAGPGGRFTFEREAEIEAGGGDLTENVYVRGRDRKSTNLYHPSDVGECVSGRTFAAGWRDAQTVVISDDRRYGCTSEGFVPSDITVAVNIINGTLGSFGTPPGLANRGENDTQLELAQGPVAIYRTRPANLASDSQIGSLVRRTRADGSTTATRLRHASGVQRFLDISPDGRSALVRMSISDSRISAKEGLAILALGSRAKPRWIYREGRSHGDLAGAAWAPNGHSVAYVTGDGNLYSHQLKRQRTVLVSRHLFRLEEMSSAAGFDLAWLTGKAR